MRRSLRTGRSRARRRSRKCSLGDCSSGLERFPAALIQSRSFDFSSGVPVRNIARFRCDDVATWFACATKRKTPKVADLLGRGNTGAAARSKPKTIARSSEAAKQHDLALGPLPNTWQIDCHFGRFDATRFAFYELPIFIGKSPFQRHWVGRDSNPEPTP